MENATISVDIGRNATIWALNNEMIMSVLPVIIVIGLISILGITGNFIVIGVYSQKYPKCNFKYFVLILAGIDMASCTVLMPLEILTFTHWFVFPSKGLCKFKSFFNAFNVTSSASCLLLIAIDRFRKVCKPHSQQIGPNLALKLTAVTLVLSIIPAASDAVFWGLHTYTVNYKGINLTAHLCEKDDMFKDTIWPKLHTTVLYSGSNVVLMTATLVLYILIAKQMFCAPGPILTPEITITPEAENGIAQTYFHFNSGGSSGNSPRILRTSSYIESGLSESEELSDTSMTRKSDEVILDKKMEQTTAESPKSDKCVNFIETPTSCESINNMCDKTTVRLSQEIIAKESKCTTLKIPEVTMRRKSSTASPKSPKSPTKENYRRRRSTLGSIKGERGTKLRRKTLIMFILTVIFIVTTVIYLGMISHMADSNDFINTLTVSERTAWLFFLRLYFINSVIDPLLYGFMDTRFRRKLWDMGVHVRWLAGSLRRNIGSTIHRNSSGRTKTEIAMTQTLRVSAQRPMSSTTNSD